MLPLPLLSLNKISWKRAAGIGGAAALVALLSFVRLQSIELGKERTATDRLLAAYRNPRVKLQKRSGEIHGPVKIKTVVVETDGRRETTTTEERGPAMTWEDLEALREPVAPAELSILMPARRAGGWMLGVSAQPLHRWERGAWAVWPGYSFGGRLSLEAGIRGDWRLETKASWRF